MNGTIHYVEYPNTSRTYSESPADELNADEKDIARRTGKSEAWMLEAKRSLQRERDAIHVAARAGPKSPWDAALPATVVRDLTDAEVDRELAEEIELWARAKGVSQ